MLVILNLIALTTFAANLSVRAIDPVLPHIADDLTVSIAQAASLSAGLAFTFAIVQPVIGAAADQLGKARLMVACLVLLGVGSILGAFATSFPVLLVTRILCGIGAGGVFPVAMGLTSDLVPLAQRQVALGRVLAGAMIGNILGASLAGIDTARASSIVFMLSGGLAAFAGALLSPVINASPDVGAFPAIKSYIIVVLGGMGSVPGSIIASLLLGVIESFGAVYLSYGYRDAFGLGLLILFLLFRPQGLFGEKGREV